MATSEHETDYLNDERLEDERRWREGPTKAQVRGALRELSAAREQEEDRKLVAEWRATNPEATCSDGVALRLAYLARSARRA